MTEGSLDTSRSLCYFPHFSYKANTFIFYAKVIQRIYIKAGEGWLSRERPVQLSLHRPPARHSAFPNRTGRRANGATPASAAHPSQCAQLAGPGLSAHTSKFGGVRIRRGRSRRKLPVLKHTFPCLFCFSIFWRERPLLRLGRDQNAIIVVGTETSTNIKGNTQA